MGSFQGSGPNVTSNDDLSVIKTSCEMVKKDVERFVTMQP